MKSSPCNECIVTMMCLSTCENFILYARQSIENKFNLKESITENMVSWLRQNFGSVDSGSSTEYCTQQIYTNKEYGVSIIVKESSITLSKFDKNGVLYEEEPM